MKLKQKTLLTYFLFFITLSTLGCNKTSNTETFIIQKKNKKILADKNFKKIKAPESNWEQAYLRRSSFDKANLEKANFKNCFAFRASFQKANLKGANFKESDLRFSDLRGADLRGADFTNALLYDARFDGALIDKTTRITFSEGDKSSIFMKD